MSTLDVETRLSSVRLKWLDKKKEVREAVHEHYLDLVGVADHSIRISEHADSLMNAYDRMPGLSRSLRLKATTAKLSGSHSVMQEHVTAPTGLSEFESRMEALLSLKSRILFLANERAFGSIRNILDHEVPEIRAFITSNNSHALVTSNQSLSGLESLVMSGCWRGVSGSTLDSLPEFRHCLGLLKDLAPEGLVSEFWQRRASLISQTTDVLDQLKLFDLTVSAASQSGLDLSSDFISQFGSSTGLIASRLTEELRTELIEKVHARYTSLREGVEDFRLHAKISKVPGVNILNSCLDQVVREICTRAVHSALENVDIETLRIEVLVRSVNGLISEISRFADIFSPEASESLVSGALDKRLFLNSVECDGKKLASGMKSSELLHALRNDLGRLDITKSLSRIEELERDSFDIYFDSVCADLAGTHTEVGACIGFGRAVDKDIPVPTHMTSGLFGMVFGVSIKISELPNVAWSAAVESAKTALIRVYTARIRSERSPTLQTLFDAACLLVLCSSIRESSDYAFFQSDVYKNLQEQVLSDKVNLILYRELIMQSAFLAVGRSNEAILHVFIVNNPLVLYYGTSELPVIEVSSVLDSLVGRGSETVERFPVLPITKTVVAQSSKAVAASKAAAPKRQTSAPIANSVTSFFNQVGKITLGSK